MLTQTFILDLTKNSTSIIIAIYVDYCIVVSQHLHLIHELKRTLEKKIEDVLWRRYQILSWHPQSSWRIVDVDPRKIYARNYLHIFDMDNCHAIATPMEVGYMMSRPDPCSSNFLFSFHFLENEV